MSDMQANRTAQWATASGASVSGLVMTQPKETVIACLDEAHKVLGQCFEMAGMIGVKIDPAPEPAITGASTPPLGLAGQVLMLRTGLLELRDKLSRINGSL